MKHAMVFSEEQLAEITWIKFVARLHRLYEQKKSSVDCTDILGEHVQKWFRWSKARVKFLEALN